MVKKPATAEAPYIQIESITASWMTEERLLDFISRTLVGDIGLEVEWAREVRPRLESSEQHRRCHLCA